MPPPDTVPRSLRTPTAPAVPLAVLLAVPRTVSPPYTPASLGCSPVAWDALLRDGDLVEVRPGSAVARGTVLTARVRAASVADLLPRDVVVGRATAAWIYTGTPATDRVCVLYAPGGYRPRDAPTLTVCQAGVRAWERSTVGGVPVTTPLRTAMDVATWCDDPVAETALDALGRDGLDLSEAVTALDRVASWRGAGRARARLLSALHRSG